MSNVGNFDYKMLMKNKDIEIDLESEIIKTYNKLDLKSKFMIDDESDKVEHLRAIYNNIRQKFLEINSDKYEVVDILIEYLYKYKNESYKTTLWECFGDIIVENLKNNITQHLDDGWIMCDVCGKRVERTINNRKYCDECQIIIQQHQKNKWKREKWKKSEHFL